MSVPASELAAMQATAASSLDLVATIKRKTSFAPDGRAHQTPTYTTVLQNGQSTLACGMAEPSADIMRLYPEEFLAPSRRSVFSFPVTGTDVKPDDRITVGGRTYRVQADASHDSYPTLLQVIAAQVGTIVS